MSKISHRNGYCCVILVTYLFPNIHSPSKHTIPCVISTLTSFFQLHHSTFWKTSEIVEFVFPGIGKEAWVVPERGPLWSSVLPVQSRLQVYAPLCPYPGHDFFGNQRLQNKFEYKIIISTVLICHVSTLTLMRESAGKGIENIAFVKAPKMSF